MAKPYKELIVQLKNGLWPTGVYRIPIKHIGHRIEREYIPGRVNKYANMMKKGRAKTVPPIRVLPKKWVNQKHGRPFAIVNGKHRLAAHKKIGRKTIKAKIGYMFD